MSVRRSITFSLVLLAAGCRPAVDVDVSKPEAFARHAVLQPASGAKLQRVTLPPALLAASQRRDLGDIRLFDARGRLVALAMLDRGALGTPRRTVELPVYPVLGGGEDLKNSHLTIQVQDGGTAQAVTVDRTTADPQGRMPAVLLDTRALREPIDAIALEADIRAGRPVPLTLLTSRNLKDWEPLAEKVLFRPSGGGPLLGGVEVPLNGAELQGRFVGISWTGPGGFALTGASAITAGSAQAQRIALPADPLSLTDAHQLQFTLPDNDRLATIRVTPSAADGIVPVRLSGRSPGRDSWSLVAVATLSADPAATTIDLPATPFASYKLDADRRTAGFSAAPKVELLFDPVDLLVVLSGTPPYRLSVGQSAAAPNTLTLAEIAPAGTINNLAALPRATLAGADVQTTGVQLQGQLADGSQDRRKPILWTALLLGTLVLAFAAFQLLRTGRAGSPERTD